MTNMLASTVTIDDCDIFTYPSFRYFLGSFPLGSFALKWCFISCPEENIIRIYDNKLVGP